LLVRLTRSCAVTKRCATLPVVENTAIAQSHSRSKHQP